MKYSEAIAQLEALIGNPSEGLPEEVFLFVSRLTPMVNVDLLIKDDGGRTLLTWRDDRHFGKGWHVPGGIVRFKETISHRIAEVARTELGAKVSHGAEPLMFYEYLDRERTERAHGISLLYACRLLGQPAPDMEHLDATPRRGQWRWHQACPEDILDVHSVYRNYI